MKVYNYISMLFLAATVTFASCSQNEELGGENMEAMQGFQINVFDDGFQDVEANKTRAIENNYTTRFAEGDAIGIFAVKGEAVVGEINNRKFTMQDGIWTLDDDGDPIEYKGSEYQKMNFYAYYPFDKNVVFDPTKTEPFETYINNWKVGNDQSEGEYTKYDLMISTGVVDGDRLKGKISFAMKHQMALAVIQMPKLVYAFTNANVDDYALPVTVGSFTLNNAETIPYYQESTDTYRFLINPKKDFSIKGTYDGVKEMEYTAGGTLDGGTARMYTINDPNKIDFTLAVGDYFCADGRIVNKGTEPIPDNVVGIVCYVGNPQPSITHPENNTETNDALRRDYPDCKHGLVLALNNTSESTGKFSSWRDTGSAYCDWFSKDEDWIDKFVDCNTLNSSTLWENKYPAFMGYNNTMLLTMCYEGKGTQTMCDDAYNQISAYRNSVAVPDSSTPWYLPSISCLAQVAGNLMTVNSSLGKVAGATEMQSVPANSNSGFYWSSTLRNGYTTWVHGMDGGSFNKSNSYGSIPGYFRMMLAF